MADGSAETGGDRPTREVARSDVFAMLIESSPEGVVVLDQELRILYMNDAGSAMLGCDRGALDGQSALSFVPEAARDAVREALLQLPEGAGRGSGSVVMARGGPADIEYSYVVGRADGQRRLTGFFRDVTDAGPAHQRERAFARIAASVAFAGSLATTLDGLAASVAEATSMVACAVVVCDGVSPELHVAGTHGLPREYPGRFAAALKSGVELPAVEAFETGRTVVVRRAADDPALEAPGTLDEDLLWGTLVCVPMSARGQTVGALKCFFGQNSVPDPDGMVFLAAVADQAAVAVDNARWFARASDARERQRALVQAGLAFASELSLPAVLQRAVESACNLTGARSGALAIVGPDGRLVPDVFVHDPSGHCAWGPAEDERRDKMLATLIDGNDGRPREPVADERTTWQTGASDDADVNGLSAPVTMRGRTYGVLSVADEDLAFTDDDELCLVTLAAQAAVAIENARLFAERGQRVAMEARNRLARELHDSVSQAVFSMTLEARAAQLALEREGLDPTGALGVRLARLRDLAQGAQAEMRALIFELRPEALSEEGLVAALRKHAGGVSARADISIEIEAPDVISLPVEVEEQLYRVVQEALNNVAKHARATAVRVRVASTDDGRRLLLEVSDDGCGFELASARPGHMGLTTMRQRIERLGGRLEVSASAGAGTTVRAVVPLHTAAPGSSA